MSATLVFLIAVLATWRLTALLCYDKLLNSFRLRYLQIVDPDTGEPLSVIGKVLACFWCTTLVVSIPVTMITMLAIPMSPSIVLWPLAISGGAIVVNYASRIAIAVER